MIKDVRYILFINTSFDSYAMIIFDIGFIMLVGYILGKLAEKIHLPNITGYLIGGLILGPITHYLSSQELSNLKIISDLALGFIAFQVGNELWLGKLKKTGKRIAIITFTQAILTTIVVSSLLLIAVDISMALILGGIATATAPAAIMTIINKYKTKGPLTDTIVPIVGLDDAVGVVIFGILLSMGTTLAKSGAINISFFELFKEPLKEIGLSILFGSLIGLVSGLASRTLKRDNESRKKSLDFIIITVFITVGVAMLFGASPILTPMIAGAFVANLVNKDTYVLEEETIRFFIPPLMILFFTLSGAKLSFQVLVTVGLIGFIYIMARILGKVGGSWLGASLCDSKPVVKKYLGISMLPQSGVAIGLALVAYNALSDIDMVMANSIQNITLASALIFELVGPVLLKFSFSKSGEITSEASKS